MSENPAELKKNYETVLNNIREAALSAGRDPASVRLIAVSKTKPVSMMRELYALGQREFGENHVQEILEKREEFPEAVYHMIGHLQRNKVRQVVGKAVMIHSVDSIRLAEEISKESVKRGLISPVLLEINVGNEESKYGFRFDEAEEAVRAFSLLPSISLRGFMCVAPYVADPEENRPLFHKMCDLAVDIRTKNIDNIHIDELSMGMTNDYRVAVQEGATIVRVGTALFGSRG